MLQKSCTINKSQNNYSYYYSVINSFVVAIFTVAVIVDDDGCAVMFLMMFLVVVMVVAMVLCLGLVLVLVLLFQQW